MMLKTELERRFGVVKTIIWREKEFYLVTIPEIRDCQILMTSKLHHYEMVNPKEPSESKCFELFFCLPNYWSESDLQNNEWTHFIMDQLMTYVIDHKTWFGDGHTMQIKNENGALSWPLNQSHCMLSSPILLRDELKTIDLGDKQVSFLSIMPLFKQEFQFKQAYGTNKLLELFEQRQVTERIDGFRTNLAKSRWRRIFG